MSNDPFQEFFQSAINGRRYPSWTYPKPLPKPKALPRQFKPITEVLKEQGLLPDNWYKDEKFWKLMGWKPLVLKRKIDSE